MPDRPPGGAPAPGPRPKSPVLLASVGTVSGPVGGTLLPMVQGAQLWVKAINQKGGINGHEVQLIVYDDGGDPARHRAQVQEAIERRHVIAFLQNAELFTGAGSVEYITAKGVPIVGISGGEDWAGSSPMYFPHVPFGDALPRTALASTAQQLVPSGRTKLGTLVCVEAPACDGFDRSLAEAAKPLGFEPVYRARGSTAQPDYTAECLAAQSAGAQVIFVALDTNALGRIAAACARQGYRPVLSTFSTVAADAMKTDPNLDGHMVASSPVFPYFQSGTPATDEFQQALRTLGRGLQVGVGTAVGWTAGKLMERATTALTDPPTSQAILAGLWSVKGDTLGGLGPPLSFTENRPPEAPGCWFNLTLQGRTWRSPDANRLNCRPSS